jgi:hypothetical protein
MLVADRAAGGYVRLREVLQVKVRAGEYYQTGGDPLAVLGDTSRMTVRMDVDERDVGRVVLGAPVVVRASAYPGVDFAGRVVEVGRRMGRKNGRADAPLGLMSGQRTTCYVAGRAPQDAAARSAPVSATAIPARPAGGGGHRVAGAGGLGARGIQTLPRQRHRPWRRADAYRSAFICRMLLSPSMPDRHLHADATLPRASGALRALASGDLVADRYRLVSVLGRGGMGEVWEAHHAALDRRVALKLVHVGAEPMRARLLHEARLLASLRHPSIVAVHDAGVTADGVGYLAMDILVGDSLATRLARARLDVPIAAALFVEVLDGLVAAHAAGIVHRDIKPDNIVLAERDGVVVPTLIDFGIAVPLVGDGVAPERAGTPQYMAPEQLRGLACDARTDVWSSCVSLYEAITGRLPFMGPDLATTASNVLDAPLAYPTDVAAMDGKLWTILTRGLRKDSADRIASAAELRQALSAWLARRTVPPGESPAAPEPRTPSASNALEMLIKSKLTGV